MKNTKASNANPQPTATKAPAASTKAPAKPAWLKGIDVTDNGGGSILGHIWASIGVTLVLGVICCGLYPLAVWAIAQTVFPNQANGSLVS